MKLKKLFTVLAAAVLAMALLTACGGGEGGTTTASAKTPAEVKTALLEANPISNPLEITADHLFLLDYLLVEEGYFDKDGNWQLVAIREGDSTDYGVTMTGLANRCIHVVLNP